MVLHHFIEVQADKSLRFHAVLKGLYYRPIINGFSLLWKILRMHTSCHNQSLLPPCYYFLTLCCLTTWLCCGHMWETELKSNSTLHCFKDWYKKLRSTVSKMGVKSWNKTPLFIVLRIGVRNYCPLSQGLLRGFPINCFVFVVPLCFLILCKKELKWKKKRRNPKKGKTTTKNQKNPSKTKTTNQKTK